MQTSTSAVLSTTANTTAAVKITALSTRSRSALTRLTPLSFNAPTVFLSRLSPEFNLRCFIGKTFDTQECFVSEIFMKNAPANSAGAILMRVLVLCP